MQKEIWHTLQEASRTLNVSEITLRRRIKSGKIQAKLEHGKYFIKLNEEKSPFIKEREKPYPVIQSEKKESPRHLKLDMKTLSEPKSSETSHISQTKLKRKILNQSCLIKFLEELLLKYRKV